MIPLKDTIPSRRTPYITFLLILVNTLIFVYQTQLPHRQLQQFIVDYGFIPLRMTREIAQQSFLTAGIHLPMYTNMFLHGGWLHLITNMWILWLFGDNVEDRMGPLRFLIFYILGGFTAGLVHYFFNTASPIPAVGASGAIAGVMGAYFLLFPQAKILTLVPIFIFPLFIKIPAGIYLLFWFISQLFSGITHTLAGQSVSGIAWWAHAGGFIAGVLIHRLFVEKDTVKSS